MTKENNNLDEDRFFDLQKKKLRRIKIGIILAIIAGTVIVASEGIIVSATDNMNVKDLNNYLLYRDGVIDYDEYNDRRYDLLNDLFQTTYAFSIVSNIARISINIVFIFIIIGLLSISIDRSFNKKMRRISLILASIILLFVLASIFIPTNTNVYYVY
ncbi:MAG: hypothetical protein ACFFEN_07920 [Candidatus Thorarchaeota archaeon]